MRCTVSNRLRLALAGLLLPTLLTAQDRIDVADGEALQQALRSACPGTEIVLAAGSVFEGGVSIEDVRGTLGSRIVLRSSDPDHPAILRGGDRSGLHLRNTAWLEIRDLVIEKSKGHGLHIEDGGPESLSAAEGILLERVQVRQVGGGGHHDGILLAGLRGFRVIDCRIERWGDHGCGIELVGCRDGVVENCTLAQRRNRGASGIRIQGGSRNVAVRRCRLEHAGARALSLGGKTRLEGFRERPGDGKPLLCEASDLTVEGCTVIGSETPLVFVGVDGALVRRNTFYLPEKWVFRILQESEEGFVPCRGGVMRRNLFVLDRRALKHGLNVGKGTDPDSFRFESNAWWSAKGSIKASVRLPTRERRPVHGRQPRFADAEKLDLRQHPRSPLRKFGADALD